MTTNRETYYEALEKFRQALIDLGGAYKRHYLLPLANILNKFKSNVGQIKNKR